MVLKKGLLCALLCILMISAVGALEADEEFEDESTPLVSQAEIDEMNNPNSGIPTSVNELISLISDEEKNLARAETEKQEMVDGGCSFELDYFSQAGEDLKRAQEYSDQGDISMAMIYVEFARTAMGDTMVSADCSGGILNPLDSDADEDPEDVDEPVNEADPNEYQGDGTGFDDPAPNATAHDHEPTELTVEAEPEKFIFDVQPVEHELVLPEGFEYTDEKASEDPIPAGEEGDGEQVDEAPTEADSTEEPAEETTEEQVEDEVVEPVEEVEKKSLFGRFFAWLKALF